MRKIKLELKLLVLNLILVLCAINLLPLAIIFIHQVSVPIESVLFFGFEISGGFIYDLGLLIVFIFFSILSIILIYFEFLILKQSREKGGD